MPQPEYNDGQPRFNIVPAGSADALSRLPLPYTPDEKDETYVIKRVPEEVNFLFSSVDQVPLSAKDIAKETQEDITFKAVFQCLSSG